jgi:hypothetical protein
MLDGARGLCEGKLAQRMDGGRNERKRKDAARVGQHRHGVITREQRDGKNT